MVQELQRKLIEQEKKLKMIEHKKMVEKEKEDKEQKNTIKDREKQEEPEKDEDEDEDEVRVPEEQEELERKDEADGTNTETVVVLENEKKKDGQEPGEEPQKSKGKSKKTVPNRKRTRGQMLKEKEVKQELDDAHRKKNLFPAEKFKKLKYELLQLLRRGEEIGDKRKQLAVQSDYEDEEGE
ncbi:uncharacterized protein [Spinacia oleracea]|uniref:Uncharacterized protein n=1 Tax=Spinacia oleracea TaxID=3562 RepID=A0ABM3QYK1_SPIOL|nr:uncharacterized protein LOC130463367 [Spinacia oleracea]